MIIFTSMRKDSDDSHFGALFSMHKRSCVKVPGLSRNKLIKLNLEPSAIYYGTIIERINQHIHDVKDHNEEIEEYGKPQVYLMADQEARTSLLVIESNQYTNKLILERISEWL